MHQPDEDCKWKILRIKARHDKKVARTLQRLGIEHFLPLMKIRRKWSDRFKWIEMPILSPYLFVKIKEKEQNKVFVDPAVQSYLWYDGEIAQVSDVEINNIREFCMGHKDLYFEHEFFHHADQCIIECGLLRGLHGLVEHYYNHKLVLKISGLGAIYSLEIPASMVRKIS